MYLSWEVEQNQFSPAVVFFRLDTLKGTAKAPRCRPFEAEHYRITKIAFLTPQRHDEGVPPPLPPQAANQPTVDVDSDKLPVRRIEKVQYYGYGFFS